MTARATSSWCRFPVFGEEQVGTYGVPMYIGFGLNALFISCNNHSNHEGKKVEITRNKLVDLLKRTDHVMAPPETHTTLPPSAVATEFAVVGRFDLG